MASIEIFIVLVALAAALGGSLVLLTCMAGKRAQLIKAFNIQQEMREREAQIEQNRKNFQKTEDDQSVTVSEVGTG